MKKKDSSNGNSQQYMYQTKFISTQVSKSSKRVSNLHHTIVKPIMTTLSRIKVKTNLALIHTPTRSKNYAVESKVMAKQQVRISAVASHWGN